MTRLEVLEHSLLTLVISAVLVASPAGAQDPAADSAVSSEVAAMLANLSEAGAKLVALAEATPADKFSWSPTDEVRTISEIYVHVIGTNLLLPPALGAAPPEGLEITDSPFAMMGEWEKTITSKEEVVAKLKESFDFVNSAMASITDLDTEVTLFGPASPKRAYFLIIMSHAHEHLADAYSGLHRGIEYGHLLGNGFLARNFSFDRYLTNASTPCRLARS